MHKRLAEHDSKLPETIANFWRGDTVSSVPGFLTHVISSQLDADRFDYLLRDSYAAGVDYGEFDHLWLITHLHADEQHSRLYLSSKALLATEAYIFARYHMYRTVYFHKTTRAAEVMLKLLFQRYSSMVAGSSFEKAASVVPGAPSEVVKAFSSKLELKDYLAELRNAVVIESRSLGTGLLHRRYLKTIDATGCRPDAVMKFSFEAAEFLKSKGYDASFSLPSDSPGDTPYKMYDPDSEAQNTQIYIENREGKQVEIGSLSDPVAQLKKEYALARFYFPGDVRDGIERIADHTLRA
ncbi:MAG TPA: hypothetical protein VK208_22180 [Pyrinomonadaceae bacterium]|nr:hypothetical protein [Pyrinomonadaceae bacterium]